MGKDSGRKWILFAMTLFLISGYRSWVLWKRGSPKKVAENLFKIDDLQKFSSQLSHPRVNN